MPSSLKGRGTRTVRRVPVPVPPALAQRLAAIARGRAPDDPLFAITREYEDAFRRVVAELGIDPKHTAYSLRHSAIVRMLVANVPLKLVASLCDTSPPMIERSYGRYIADAGDAVARRGMLDFASEDTCNVVAITRPRQG
jgi:hypothetical protein